jgi:PH (Pleckstrin Homology) domain-containing protein
MTDRGPLYRDPSPAPPPRSFRLSPTRAFWAILVGICAVLAVETPLAAEASLQGLIGGLVSIAVLLFLAAHLRSRVEVSDVLRVLPRPYFRRDVARAAVRRARLVDWTLEPALRPTLRTFGTGVGRYLLGWFRLANGKKALVMTGRSRVLCIETDDVWYLLGPDDLDAFAAEVHSRFVAVEPVGPTPPPALP